LVIIQCYAAAKIQHDAAMFNGALG
jgi:hypothetical protein